MGRESDWTRSRVWRTGIGIGIVILGSRLAQESATARADEQPGIRPPSVADTRPARDTSVEARMRRLEELNKAILDRLDHSERKREESDARYREMERKYEDLRKRLESDTEPEQSRERGGSGMGTRSSPDEGGGRREGVESSSNRETGGEEVPLRGVLADGFSLYSADDEYQLRLRVLDQTDLKVFSPNNQVPARSGLYIPRVRFYFEGRLTRLFDYEVSLQRSVEGVWDLLDGNVTVNLDERFRIRFGRMLVPYSYDWYDHLEQYFITPERALFPLNLGLSRSAGLMALGKLAERRLQYAVGGFEGRLFGVADNNTTRDAVAYLNLRPFLENERYPWLKRLNVGLSGFVGQQIVPTKPLPMRLSVQSSENDEAAQAASPIFLNFNDNAFALGGRSAGAVHLAWYVGGLSLETEFQQTRIGFGRADSNDRVKVPGRGMHLTASYFLTGETVTDRSRVEPLRPIDPIHGSRGPGAIEVFARYSTLVLGESVFTAGLADPNQWTNNAAITDVGFNWYLTKYIKVYFDWQHAIFGTPVQLNPSQRMSSLSDDLFWIRGQLYY